MADLFVHPCGCVENHHPACPRYRLVVDPRDAEIAALREEARADNADAIEAAVLAQDEIAALKAEADTRVQLMADTVDRFQVRAEKAEAELDAVLADFSRELDEARKQITESVMEWARKSGCVYCGEVFDTLGPEGERETRRALYTAHTKVCAGHPMRDVEARAEEAEAACAEMRAALEAVVAETSLAFAVAKANQALSRPDLGRGWASPEVVAKVRDAAIKCGDCVLCQGTAERHDDGCPIADLDALLKKGGG